MTQPDTPQLDYAPPPPMHRRKLVRRTLIIGAALIPALWVARSASMLWQQAQLRYWRYQCLTYSPPADRIVYEDGAPSPASWKDAPISHSPTVLTSNGAALAGGGTPYERWCRLVGDPVYGAGRFYRTDSVVFLHRRTDPSGHERLVMVRLAMRSSYQVSFHSASWPVQGPSGTYDSREQQAIDFPAATRAQKLRLFAGQPDPADDSHFTLRYDLDGQPGTIDGWLRQDGVHLKVRDGPGMQR